MVGKLWSILHVPQCSMVILVKNISATPTYPFFLAEKPIALIQIFQIESNGPCYLEQRLLGGWLEIENRGFKTGRFLWIFHDLPWKNHVQ